MGSESNGVNTDPYQASPGQGLPRGRAIYRMLIRNDTVQYDSGITEWKNAVKIFTAQNCNYRAIACTRGYGTISTNAMLQSEVFLGKVVVYFHYENQTRHV